MKWLVYSPVSISDISGDRPRYRKGDVAPVFKWYQYRAHPLLEGTEEFWAANSKIDPVKGAYCGAPIRLLKADYTFGWDIEDLDQYDGIFVSEADAITYLRLKKKYNGIIIAFPRLPRGSLRYPSDMIKHSDLVLLNHEPGLETVENLNTANMTDKFFLLTVPTVDISFLEENFHKDIHQKEKRIVTYRVSSGPLRREPHVLNITTAKRWRNRLFLKIPFTRRLYLRTAHRFAKGIEKAVESNRMKTLSQTAEYLKAFRRVFPDLEGYMTKGKGEAPSPFVGVDVDCADDYYRFIGESYLIVLASATYASITLYGACVGTPSVGSVDTTAQKMLFPELSFAESDVSSVVGAMKKLFEDTDFYREQQQQGKRSLHEWFSDEALKRKLSESLKGRGLRCDL